MAKHTIWAKRAQPVWHAIKEGLNAGAPDIGDFDWPLPEHGDEDDDPLFDSTRGYVEQIDRYKDHQGKPTGRRRNLDVTPTPLTNAEKQHNYRERKKLREVEESQEIQSVNAFCSALIGLATVQKK